MKYARLNFFSVTYRQQGQSRIVLLTPVEAHSTSVCQINDGVGRWYERLRQDVKRATGALPHRTEPASLLSAPSGPGTGRPCPYSSGLCSLRFRFR
jgi:hypothetical protein